MGERRVGILTRSIPSFVVALGLIGALCTTLLGQALRPMKVEDAVGTIRVFEGQVDISPDGAFAAYVVKAPNVTTNKNAYRLYVRGLDRTDRRDNGRLLLESDSPIERLRWVSQGKKLVVLRRGDANEEIMLVESETGKREVVVSSNDPIGSFSVSEEADYFAYSGTLRKADQSHSIDYSARGFPVTFGKGIEPPGRSEESGSPTIIILKRKENGQSITETLYPDNSGLCRGIPTLRSVSELSVSPNGRYVAFNYTSDEVPAAWQSNVLVRWLGSTGNEVTLLGMCDLKTSEFRLLFSAPLATAVAWSQDSEALSLNSISPIGSSWEQDDAGSGFTEGTQYEDFVHLFVVKLKTKAISQALKQLALYFTNPTLFWKKGDGQMLVRKDSQTYQWLSPGSVKWSEGIESRQSVGEVELAPSVVNSGRPNAASDGNKVVGVLQQLMRPPDLFIHDLKANQTTIVTDLNPELRHIALGSTERIEWHDRFGTLCKGILIKPVDFDLAKHYPAVIMTKGWPNNWFFADTQFQTTFPPQPLASAGFLVLLAQEPRPEDNLKGFPGEMGEAYKFIAMVESAIRTIVERYSGDENNVGTIGFSRTSWLTDFMLTHSDLRFSAASSSDSGIYNYGSYWRDNSDQLMADYERQLGGAPYGPTFDNWLKFSPAFNAQKVRTPLLMESTHSPVGTIRNMEFFVALRKQGKPVELYYYPHGEHILDTPFERVASLQRNRDWFRFWMQGYEGKAPEYDPDQYVRWRTLRKLWKQSLEQSQQTTSPSAH
jgi:dipeptidyl aminopeptidase/acylaminoacyl peptidase